MGYGTTKNSQTKRVLCKYCGFPIQEKPYKEFAVWIDFLRDDIFCGARSGDLPHEPKELSINESLD